MKHLIKIERMNNGAVLRGYDIEGQPASMVYQFDDDNLEGLVWLLDEVAAQLGQYGDRDAAQRIEIKIIHGDKYDCRNKECAICTGFSREKHRCS